MVENSSVLGEEDPSDLIITFNPWGYPVGSRLSWHNDAGAGRVGAFVLFVHEQWDPGWGGALAIGDTDLGPVADKMTLFWAPAAPQLVFPLPNRLAIFRSGTMHSLFRVRAEAFSAGGTQAGSTRPDG
jgi:Rps23 Pro-64 3,4-dihydroxylase Tpa1-like proline 4-hydroxylase